MKRLFSRSMMLLALVLCGGCPTETRFTGVQPSYGTYSGGEEIELSGQNFPRSNVVVRFAGRDATSVVVVSDKLIRAVSPAGERGSAADVTITFDDGRAFVMRNGFRYVDSTQQRETLEKFLNHTRSEGK